MSTVWVVDVDGDRTGVAVFGVTLCSLVRCECVVKVEEREEVCIFPVDVGVEGTTLELVASDDAVPMLDAVDDELIVKVAVASTYDWTVEGPVVDEPAPEDLIAIAGVKADPLS